MVIDLIVGVLLVEEQGHTYIAKEETDAKRDPDNGEGYTGDEDKGNCYFEEIGHDGYY